MEAFTIWIQKETSILIGGQTDKPIPVITGKLMNPQIKIDPEKGTIVITETK